MISDEALQFIEEKYPGLGINLSICVGMYHGEYCFIENSNVSNDAFNASVEYVVSHLDQLKDISRYYVVPHGLHWNLESDSKIYSITGNPIAIYLSDDELTMNYVYDIIRGGYNHIYGITARGEKILSPWRIGFVKTSDKAVAALKEHTSLMERVTHDFACYDSELREVSASLIPFPSHKKADFESDFPSGKVVVGNIHDVDNGKLNLHTITSVKANKAYDEKGNRHYCGHLFLYDPKLDYVKIGKQIEAIEVKRSQLYDEQFSSWNKLDEIKRRFSASPTGNNNPNNYLSPVL